MHGTITPSPSDRVASSRPRVRYHVGEEGPVASIVEGSLEDAVDGVPQAERPLSAEPGDDVVVVEGAVEHHDALVVEVAAGAVVEARGAR